MNLSLMNRYAFYAVCVLFTLFSLPWLEQVWGLTLVTALLSAIGTSWRQARQLRPRHRRRQHQPLSSRVRR
ncbi:hypothetical protein NAV28_08255 [Pseudomonas stutzeri]|nr:hypothetical protein [Stutzerimonas degradans]